LEERRGGVGGRVWWRGGRIVEGFELAKLFNLKNLRAVSWGTRFGNSQETLIEVGTVWSKFIGNNKNIFDQGVGTSEGLLDERNRHVSVDVTSIKLFLLMWWQIDEWVSAHHSL
jgi:hypothetical protein